MVDHIQGAIIGPVDVFQKDDGRRQLCCGLKELGQVDQGAVTELFGVVKGPLQVGAVAEIKAEQLPDKVSAHLPSFVCAQHFANPRLHLLPHHPGPVAVLNLEAE